jgi:gliding motility-associated-like protein
MVIRNYILILVFNLITVVTLYAQPYTSRLGRFKVDQVKGCAPFLVTITDTNVITTGECTPGKPCLMDYENKGQQQQNQFTFTYNTAGTYKLSVLYQSIGADDITITVVDNIQPAFEMYSCAGNKVSIRVMDNKYEQYVIDFNNDGTPEDTQPYTNTIVSQHSYPGAGTYNISVRGLNTNSADNCTATVQPFTTITTLPTPNITQLAALDASTLKLNFGKQTDIQQHMEIAVNNAGPFQLYQSLYEKDTLRATSLKVDDNYYCFRLSAYDPCANTNNYSNIICSQNFDLDIQNAVNKLAWITSPAGITSVSILRDKQSYSTIPGAPLSFDDNDVVCNTSYCYQVITNYANNVKSISLEKCGTSFTTATPPQINNISAIVTDPGVDLEWLVDPKVNQPQFTLLRSAGGGAYSPFATTTDKKFTDGEYTTSGVYCYRIDYTDACGNVSPEGVPVCPVRLGGNLDDSNVTTINWSKFNGWVSGVKTYVVERHKADGTLINSVNVGTDTSYVEDPDPKIQIIYYRIRAVAISSGLTASFSNTIEIAKKTNLYFPTAFTPNHDKLNETFSVNGHYITKINLKIFDRWGVLVYASEGNSSEAWNGNRGGSGIPMPEGTYVWKAEITDLSGKNFSREGTVLLIRKGN